jgi:hypothetical protein
MSESKSKLIDCPGCGRINNAAMDKCRECGTSLSDIGFDEPSEGLTLSLSINKRSIGIGCVALIVFGVFMLYPSSSGEDALRRHLEAEGLEDGIEKVEIDTIESKGPFSILFVKKSGPHPFSGKPISRGQLRAINKDDDIGELIKVKSCSANGPSSKEIDEFKAELEWDLAGLPLPFVDTSIRYSQEIAIKLRDLSDEEGPYTEVQKRSYLKSLVGKQVHLKGEVMNVYETNWYSGLKDYSGFSVSLSCSEYDRRGMYFITCNLSEEDKDLVMSLSKGKEVDVIGYVFEERGSRSSFDRLVDLKLSPSKILLSR